MITIENTKNLTGVTIKGDYNDFQQLVDAFYELTIDDEDEKYKAYYDMSTRVLGLCYNIRHASMGDREIKFEENGTDREMLSAKSMIAPEYNVYYSCNYYYPEMMFIMLALNQLILLRMNKIQKPKNSYREPLNKMVIWDSTINTIRSFQSAFNDCVKNTLSPNSYTRWINVMNNEYLSINDINHHYIDLHNIKYLKLDRETRLKKLSSISKKLVEFRFDREHEEIMFSIREGALELGCDESEVVLKGFEYPEKIQW